MYYDMDNPDAVMALIFLKGPNTPLSTRSRRKISLKPKWNYLIIPTQVYFGSTAVLRTRRRWGADWRYGEELSRKDSAEQQNLLKGDVLGPQESLTLELVMDPEVNYEILLKSSDNLEFKKNLDGSSENDFLVFYDSDLVKDWENRSLVFINRTTEEIKEIYAIDQENGTRVEVLKGEILGAGEEIEYLLTENIIKADLIIKTASNSKIYIFDWDFSSDSHVEITDE